MGAAASCAAPQAEGRNEPQPIGHLDAHLTSFVPGANCIQKFPHLHAPRNNPRPEVARKRSVRECERSLARQQELEWTESAGPDPGCDRRSCSGRRRRFAYVKASWPSGRRQSPARTRWLPSSCPNYSGYIDFAASGDCFLPQFPQHTKHR